MSSLLFCGNNSGVIVPNSTFIWAPPSHGNVGQIAIDCLIQSQNVTHVGLLKSDLLMPITG